MSCEETKVNEIPLKLLTAKLSEAQDFTRLFLTSFSIYVVISGALLKFAIEAQIPLQKTALTAMGLLTSATYLTACLLVAFVRRAFCQDVGKLNQCLGQPLISEQFLAIKYASIAAGLFTTLAFLGWIYLLFHNL